MQWLRMLEGSRIKRMDGIGSGAGSKEIAKVRVTTFEWIRRPQESAFGQTAEG